METARKSESIEGRSVACTECNAAPGMGCAWSWPTSGPDVPSHWARIAAESALAGRPAAAPPAAAGSREPTPSAPVCRCVVTSRERQENPACPVHFPPSAPRPPGCEAHPACGNVAPGTEGGSAFTCWLDAGHGGGHSSPSKAWPAAIILPEPAAWRRGEPEPLPGERYEWDCREAGGSVELLTVTATEPGRRVTFRYEAPGVAAEDCDRAGMSLAAWRSQQAAGLLTRFADTAPIELPQSAADPTCHGRMCGPTEAPHPVSDHIITTAPAGPLASARTLGEAYRAQWDRLPAELAREGVIGELADAMALAGCDVKAVEAMSAVENLLALVVERCRVLSGHQAIAIATAMFELLNGADDAPDVDTATLPLPGVPL